MKLLDMNLRQFSTALASDAPTPGGGSMAALNGALGVSLTHMVCMLSVGKEKYAQHENLLRTTITEASSLQVKLLELVQRDTDAYDAVTNALKLPKDTEDEKAKRSAAMQSALKHCALVPFEVMCTAMKALELTEQIAGKSNPNAASDLGVAALNLNASVQGAWLNVLINLDGIKDSEFVNEYKEKGKVISSKAETTAEALQAI